MNAKPEPNSYSRPFYRAILQRLPELSDSITVESDGVVFLDCPTRDKRIKLQVSTEDNDACIGFGMEWHTHSDLLVFEDSPETEAEALVRFIEDIFGGKYKIFVVTRNGQLEDVGLTDDPESELEDPVPGRSVEILNWSEIV